MAELVVTMARCGCSTQCWRAKCSGCGEWLTKHDWDEDGARRSAEFDKHVCHSAPVRPYWSGVAS